MSEECFFKNNNVLENPLFCTSVTEHPVCVDTNSGSVSEDRIARADYKTASEAGLSSGYTFSDAAAKLTGDNMLITDGGYYFSGLPYDTYIVEMTTAASSNGGTTYGIGYFLVDDGRPSVKPQALNQEIVGDAVIGEKLTASFTYKGNSISEGTPKYEWLQSDSFGGEYSVISTDKEYTVKESDAAVITRKRPQPVPHQMTDPKDLIKRTIHLRQDIPTMFLFGRKRQGRTLIHLSVST